MWCRSFLGAGDSKLHDLKFRVSRFEFPSCGEVPKWSYRDRLESDLSPKAARGFESHPLRQPSPIARSARGYGWQAIWTPDSSSERLATVAPRSCERRERSAKWGPSTSSFANRSLR